MRHLFFWLLGLAGGLLWGCDALPGAPSLEGRPPVVSELSFTPDSVDFNTLPPAQIQGDTAFIPLSIAVRAHDPDGQVVQVAFVVQAPLSTPEPVATGTLEAIGGDRYAGQTILRLHRAQVGPYTVLVYAVDNEQRLSNQVRGTLWFWATGGPPVIEAVQVPDTLRRPAPGEPPVVFQVVARVSDPDGLENILRVELRVNEGAPILLCDDGSKGICGGIPNSGDAVAGDSLFTMTLSLAHDNVPGTYTFAFQAIDRTGLTSEEVRRHVVVE
ncbi:hypothetical protein [Rhodothermus profundi]|uniref:Uncharacterized protein n=1 Tax=Rhodothermus profundi TaxID=633813 RepID=A0A1M6TPW3_9BACT|nr:hypothetical protein [Rhodothermus profundi]SHK58977.1 hypothetical protein SAMN04488087_1482 [Rhodothermus profundi]